MSLKENALPPVKPVNSTIEPIAILGIGCRYPQAAGLEAFWRLLLEGRDAIAPYPGGRFRELDAEYAATAAGGGKVATALGGFLPGIDRFDAAFFGISPREAIYVDPQQRLLLEVSWDALEDAGQLRENYDGTRTGVFTGIWTTEYEQLMYRMAPKPEFYMLTGGSRSTACGRMSFTFGFEGPSVSVDTACSSSMVAIHLACQALRNGECDMALAGGANVILMPDQTRLFTHSGMLAGDGHCKFGDASGDGFVRSEGAGMVVLKRLSDAVAAGDPIYGVIRGSSVNNDGRSGGLMVTPSREGQKNMLLEAWREAGVSASEISYIEAHGTGTHAGDPVEIGAIGDALREAGATERVPLGSIKSNFGHTESAAGVAGVIKAVMVLHEGMIPKSLHHANPNPEVDWEGSPIAVATEARVLPARVDGQPRNAGASSFGLTGTNSHMLLGEYVASATCVGESTVPASLLLPLTAYSMESLKGNARRWVEYLERGWSPGDVAEMSYLAGARRTHLQHRFTAVGSDSAELKRQLEAFAAGEASTSPEAGEVGSVPKQVVFVAPGQGSQWDGMARELYRENAPFRESFVACDHAIAFETGWSLLERLEGEDAATYLTQIDFVQPALFAMSVALAAVWRAAGVVPGAVVGHSMGEAAAAYIAGALSLEDAAAVICRRSKLMRRLSGSGSMASVELPPEEIVEWLRPFSGKISIAAENSPGTTVISGESEAVGQLLDWLELKEVFCRRVKVDVASHSALVDPILEELAAQLSDLKPRVGTLPFFSTVAGAYIDGSSLDAAYWVRNLREPVRLSTATKGLLAEGYNCFVELSPHPIVVPALENTLRSVQAIGAMALPSLVRGNAALPAMLHSLGRFWIAGGKLDWAALTGRGNGPVTHRLRLPEYAFERERFWMDESEDANVLTAKLSPLLRSRTDLAHEPGTTIFSLIADLKSLPYLADHRVGGAVVFPGAAHLEAVLEAARVMWPAKPVCLSDVEFLQALYLSEAEAPDVQLMLRRVSGGEESFAFSVLSRSGSGESQWTEHSRGALRFEALDGTTALLPASPDFAVLDLNERRATGAEGYRKAKKSGIDYGPAFQLVDSFVSKRLDGRLIAQTQMRSAEDAAEYLLHPATLDACFQTLVMMRSRVPGLLGEDVYLPSALGSMRVLTLPTSLRAEEKKSLVTEAIYRGGDEGLGSLEFDLTLRTKSGRVLAVFEKFTIKRVESQTAERTAEDLFVLGWKPMRRPGQPTAVTALGRHWLLFADGAATPAASRASELARWHTGQGGRCTLIWPGSDFRPLGDGERKLDLLGADEYELPHDNPAALDRLLGLVKAEAGQNATFSDVVDLWPLEGLEASDAILRRQAWGVTFLPTLVQSITRAGWTHPPKLWMVTEGTQQVPGAEGEIRLAGATVWGMAAVLMREHPELRPCVVDLSAGGSGVEIETLGRLLLDEAPKTNAEERIALRGEMAFAQRVLNCSLTEHPSETHALSEGEAFRVETDRPGMLDQLVLRTMATEDPGPGEVAIEIAYGGMNFVEVTKALGLYPGLDPSMPLRLGGEASGRIVGVGAGVSEFKIGDEVVAITPAHTQIAMLASRAVVPAAVVAHLPQGMSLAEGATLPLAYCTAHLALNELARLRKGEWVLVHAGAGGVGLAAIKIALAIGARVIATASSPEKHAYLHAWGVDHVLQSRSLEFGNGVMEITGGRGVDVVLNSLTGDAINRSLEVLAPYGRFVELGKRDIYEDKRVGLKVFRKNLSYFAVDLAGMFGDRQEYASTMLREVMETIGRGEWKTLPVTEFSVDRVVEAFRFMAQSRHIGKLAIGFAGARDEVRVLPAKSTIRQPSYDRSASYVLTGGLGGVALTVAEWMAAHGAGCLVLVSRRLPNEEELASMERMRALGARVEHRRTDLTDREGVFSLIAEIQRVMPPLKGILHAAAVIDDALVTDLRPERFDKVFAPKLRGAWYLHEATMELQLAFFVMFSSIATIFPQPGHGSYAAANSFLDSFAAYRRHKGLPASSINWTGWVGIGLARNTGTSRTIDACAAEGLGSFDAQEATAALWHAIWANPIHAMAVRIDEEVAGAQEPIPTLLREVVGANSTPTHEVSTEHSALTAIVAAVTLAERTLLLEQLLRIETGRVLKLAPDRIGSNQVFGQLGIDSLMALELIRRVNAELGLALPATAVFNYPTLASLATQILKRMGLETVSDASPVNATPVGSEFSHSCEKMEDTLSDEDALRALMEPDLMESGESASGD
jgi:acyl transferase domain-containing protein/NADPH:quinone reductase-like Zn-dependent oxidoreductase/NADP-dependent 3-hydroxy acid dehydrogenase YdfG/acyl carrier protein